MSAPSPPSLPPKRKALRSQVLQQIEMFDRLADPLVQITRSKGRIKWANRAAADLFGADLTNRRLTKIFRSPALREALRGLRKSEVTQADHILSAQNFPGREYRVRLVRFEKKTLHGARILVAFADVTEVLQLQSQRADFVANASHELKTPVAALSGFIETLERDPAALPRFLPLMAGEARRMQALIHDLLNLTRTEMGASDLPKDALAIAPLLSQAVEGLAHVFAKYDHRLVDQTAHLPALANLRVRGDATALVTVFTNLLQNAASYAPHGSDITLSADMADQHILLHVHNPGPGIEAAHIPRLTERFYRADDGRAPTSGGTGLGLAIVKHVLIRHRGELLIQSEPGQGARFTVKLPLINPA